MDEKIKVVQGYKYFIKENKIKLPDNSKEKRKLFINYFINKDSNTNITQDIDNLSKNFLYVSNRTIEDIIFYNEQK